MLSDQAVMAIICVWEGIMAMGHVPAAITLMREEMLPKPEGGRRTIGISPGAVRPLTRWLRHGEGSRWADSHRRGYVHGVDGQGKSCEACPWKQATQSEYATARDRAAVSMLLDLAKAYEFIRRHILVAKARAMDFNVLMPRLMIGFYSARRAHAFD